MSRVLRASDTISGTEAIAYIEVDGKLEEFFYAKTIEATFEKTKSEVRTTGTRGTQHKATGWAGSGSMTIYYVSSIFRQLALKYAKDGIDTNFKLIVTNEDKSSTVGRQTVALYDCNLDSIILTKFDVEADALDEDIDFTFADFDILEEFADPSYATAQDV